MFIRETHTTNGRRRKSWTLIPGLKAWVLLFVLGLPALPTLASERLSQEELQALSVMADDGEYDLRDESNQPVQDRRAAVKEELRQASVQYQFQALFGGDLPRIAQIQGLLDRFKHFLKVAIGTLPVLLLDIIAPSGRSQGRPIAAGVFSSLAPALFACVAIRRILTVEQCRRAPAVLRC